MPDTQTPPSPAGDAGTPASTGALPPTAPAVPVAATRGTPSTAAAPTTVKTRAEVAAETATIMARKYGPPTIGVIVIMFVAWFAAGWARRAVRQGLQRARFDPTLGKFLSNIVRWIILTLAVITCLNLFGIEQTSFAAVLGAAGLAIGLGLQGSLSNLAAGVMLLIFRPFKVGDWVVVAGQAGKVNEIDLFQTTLDTADGRRIFVPNGPIFGSTIENTTYFPRRRVDVALIVQLGPTIEQTRAALDRAIRRTPRILSDPPPDANPTGFPIAGVDWLVTVWALSADFGAVKSALIQAIKEELDKAEIPLKK